MKHIPTLLPWFRAWVAAGTILTAVGVTAAPIPKLYSTGVKDDGTLLGANQVDTHYQLVESADTAYPGPQVYTLVPGFPVGPWLAEGPASRWIAPRAQQGIGNQEGSYTYRTTFDLTGFDPTKARITGKWAVDNGGTDIVLNGNSLGLSNGAGFGAFTDFVIESGFVAGTNVLDFIVSNAPSGVNPTGFRAELRGTVELPNEAPNVTTQPAAQAVILGEPFTLSVVADGTPPLSYQWRRNNTAINGATEATFTVPATAAGDAGDYTVVVSNSAGSKTSNVATVTIYDPIPGLFDTGVNDSRAVLDDGAVDNHFRLVTNPDAATTEAIVHDSSIFPIVSGPWLANSEQSKWIGPRFDTSQAAGGDYVYRLVVNLTGLDAATAFITGRWATDNDGDLLLNGAPTGLRNTAQFASWTEFRLTNGFLTGTNILEFKVNNASAGYTALRVDGLRGGAKKQTGPAEQPPRLVSSPSGVTLLTGETATLKVVADSATPMTYQWKRNNQDLSGKTAATLDLGPATLADAGSYTVTVRNSTGSTNTPAAVVVVLERVPGVFSTGVGTNGLVLADGEADPHYTLVTNATDVAVTVPVVHDSTIFPIVTGPWVQNTTVSKWIGPLLNTVEAAGGDYAYRTQFDLTGFDPASAVILGAWATDNLGAGILLNGADTGLQNGNQFSVLTPFEIKTGLVAGTNTLVFLVNNAAAGYTALRVEGLRVGAVRASTAPALQVTSVAAGVRLAWPKSATGYRLTSATSLTATSWTDVNAPVVEVGELNTVTVPASAAVEFFRLQR